jgi:hypothetical protein
MKRAVISLLAVFLCLFPEQGFSRNEGSDPKKRITLELFDVVRSVSADGSRVTFQRHAAIYHFKAPNSALLSSLRLSMNEKTPIRLRVEANTLEILAVTSDKKSPQ